MSGTHPDLWPLPPTVRAGRTMTHKKSPAGRGGRRGSWERDLGSGLRSRGSLQGRERSVTDIASVTGYMTTRHMDSSDRKRTRMNSVTTAHLVCRHLLAKKN